MFASAVAAGSGLMFLSFSKSMRMTNRPGRLCFTSNGMNAFRWIPLENAIVPAAPGLSCIATFSAPGGGSRSINVPTAVVTGSMPANWPKFAPRMLSWLPARKCGSPLYRRKQYGTSIVFTFGRLRRSSMSDKQGQAGSRPRSPGQRRPVQRPYAPLPEFQAFLDVMKALGNDLDTMTRENIHGVRFTREQWTQRRLGEIPVESFRDFTIDAKEVAVPVRLYVPH